MLFVTLWLFILKINASRIESACISYCIWIETREKEEHWALKKNCSTLTIIHLQIDTKKNLKFCPIIQVLSHVYTDGVRQRLPQICVSCVYTLGDMCATWGDTVIYVSVWVMVLTCHGIMIKPWQMLHFFGQMLPFSLVRDYILTRGKFSTSWWCDQKTVLQSKMFHLPWKIYQWKM